MGFAWFVPVSSKENNRAKTNGGGKRIIGGGGVQNRFWEGALWYVFPSPEFSTPLCFPPPFVFSEVWPGNISQDEELWHKVLPTTKEKTSEKRR